jgi:hypothetical protein
MNVKICLTVQLQKKFKKTLDIIVIFSDNC